MNKFLLILTLSALLNSNTFSQSVDLNLQNSVAFNKYLLQDGGQWKAKNVDYNENQSYGFPYFLLQFESSDSLSIQATIQGIDSKEDTLLFWSVWEFYNPIKKNNFMVQRSPSNMHATGTVTYPVQNQRNGELTLYFPNGKSLKHKDMHVILSLDTLKSSSLDFDEASNEWGNQSNLIWVREKKKVPK